MRIFCPATLLLPSLLLGPGIRAHIVLSATGAPIGPANSGPIERCAGYCAAVYLSWFTGPRGRACHPHAASSAIEIRRSQRMGPDAPVWTLVVCPTRRKPGSRQPEQYALDRGPNKIRPGSRAGSAAPVSKTLASEHKRAAQRP